MNEKITVSLSFADEDTPFAEKIVNGLIDKGIHVVSNSNLIVNKIPNWGKHLLDIVDEQFSENVDYCIVLVTKNYSKSKWNTYSKCCLLEQAYKRKNFILPVKVGQNISSLTGLSLYDYLEIKDDDFQVLIDSFIQKAKITNIGVDNLKGYRDIETILKLKDPNADWVKLSNDNDIDRERGIGFDLFANNDKLLERVQSYTLFLYENSTIKNTIEYINKIYPYIFRERNLIILIPFQKGQVDFEKRRTNIRAAFRDSKVIYIKDFIWDYCTPKDFRTVKNELPITNFVVPNIKIGEDSNNVRADDFIIKWQREDNNPLLVIKGDGGMGKTTLAKWITNYVEKNIPNTRAIFIDSSEITAYLIRSIEINNELDLYKFYEADYEEKQSRNKGQVKKLGNIEFKCNLDNGNIILIIDGFDEVLTHLDNYFNIDSFVSSIYSLSSNIGRGKVIITTRNHFWDKYNLHEGFDYKTIEVRPFDHDLTNEYFSTYFNKNKKFIEKSFEVADALMLKSNNNYIPFVLDLVTYIVENRYEGQSIKDSKFDEDDSKLLNRNINNDYLLFKICNREIIKLDKVLNIDDQINLFIRLSTIYNGKIKEKQLVDELKEMTDDMATSKTLEAIKAHPILSYSNQTSEITFKYDLFDEHFKNIYLGLFINGSEEINGQLVTILSDHNNFNSNFPDILLLRIGKIDDVKKISIINILDSIKDYKTNDRNITIEVRNRAISSLFLLILKSYHKNNSLNIETSTELLKELFSNGNQINDFSIINCTSLTSPKITFDFSNLLFNNSHFSNFEYFVDCKFNEKTLFTDCKFDNLQLNILKSYPFKSNNFIRPTGDVNFKEYFKTIGQGNYNIKKEIIEDVENFLNLFYKSGKIFNISQQQLGKKYHPKVIPLDKMLTAFMDFKLIYFYVNTSKEEKYDVYPEYRFTIIKFITNGTNAIMLEKVLSHLINLYK